MSSISNNSSLPLSQSTSAWDANHPHQVQFWGIFGHAQHASVSWDKAHDAWHLVGDIITPDSEAIDISGTAPDKGDAIQIDKNYYSAMGEIAWHVDAYLAAGATYNFYYEDNNKTTTTTITTPKAPKGYHPYDDLAQSAQHDAASLLKYYNDIKNWAAHQNMNVKQGLTAGIIEAWMAAHSYLKNAVSNISELFSTHLSSGRSLYGLIAGDSGIVQYKEIYGFVHPTDSRGTLRDRKLPASLAKGTYGWSVPTTYKALYDLADVEEFLLRERAQFVHSGTYLNEADQQAKITMAGQVLVGYLSTYDVGGAMKGTLQESTYLQDILNLIEHGIGKTDVEKSRNKIWISKLINALHAAGITIAGAPGKRHLLVNEDEHPNGIYNQQDFNRALDRATGNTPVYNFQNAVTQYVRQFYLRHGRMPNAEEQRTWTNQQLDYVYHLFSRIDFFSHNNRFIVDVIAIIAFNNNNLTLNQIRESKFNVYIETFLTAIFRFSRTATNGGDGHPIAAVNEFIRILNNFIDDYDYDTTPEDRTSGLTGTQLAQYILMRLFGMRCVITNGRVTDVGPAFDVQPAIRATEAELGGAIADGIEHHTGRWEPGIAANILRFFNAGQGSGDGGL